jgi:hypothetical protein
MEATVLGEQRIPAAERSAAAPYPLVARNGREETTRVRVGAVVLEESRGSSAW